MKLVGASDGHTQLTRIAGASSIESPLVMFTTAALLA